MSREVATRITAVSATSVAAAASCALAMSDLEAFFGPVVMVAPANLPEVNALLVGIVLVLAYLFFRAYVR